MAMSLEDLLAEEGFKRRKAKTMPRVSVASERRGVVRDASGAKRAERTRSHISRYDSKGEFSMSGSFTGAKLRLRDSCSEITEVASSDEIVEVGTNRAYKDIYSKNVYGRMGNRSRNSTRNEVHNRQRSHATTDDRRSMKQPQSSDKLSGRDKRYEESRQAKVEQAFNAPAIDEVAVKAVISILGEYVKRFVEDEEFRASLRHNSFASLVFIDEGLKSESKVVENLEEAIEIVERAAEEGANSKELKKASLQLSVITGLNTKSGSSSGIQNYKLSSCAHLYLSVIYLLQKKDATAAKHLLQVFCDSPLHARTTLLPDLWDNLFLPHLLHLQLWHDKETRSLPDSPILGSVELLDKVYNRSLDSGTYKFAMYYKDWITKGIEAPSAPVVKIPSFSVQRMPREAMHSHTTSPASRFSPKLIVSKKLYDEVFKHSHKSVAASEENNDSSARSTDSPAPVDKQLILYSTDSATCMNQNFVPNDESPTNNVPVAEEARRLHPESSSGDLIGKPALCSIPKDFICPLTDLLFEDPVTLETGQTFEREAIIEWLDKGFLTCPVTRKPLQYQTVPPTNLILKRIIDDWETSHFKHLLALLCQMTTDSNEDREVNDSMIICILEQLLTVFSKDKKMTNARRIISFGGLQFLLRQFRQGNTRENTVILPFLSCCIEADARCRNDIATNMNPSDLLELLHSKQSMLRTNTVSLLIELICSNRRIQAKCFLEGLRYEEIITAMDDLVIYLQTCSPEQMPLVAVLLLHLSILSEAQGINIYKHDAVDALTNAMERSLTDEKFWKNCSRALLILGGCFSSSGKLMTEDWILKVAGFLNGPDWDAADNEANGVSSEVILNTVDPLVKDRKEATAREQWLVSLSASLLGDGKKSFLDSTSKCLSSGNSDIIRVCLTTVAWLSSSLTSSLNTEAQLCAFSTLISPLKQCLECGEPVERKILASLSLFNFSKIPECRKLLTKFAEEIRPSLEDLAEITWTAEELHTIISVNLEST